MWLLSEQANDEHPFVRRNAELCIGRLRAGGHGSRVAWEQLVWRSEQQAVSADWKDSEVAPLAADVILLSNLIYEKLAAGEFFDQRGVDIARSANLPPCLSRSGPERSSPRASAVARCSVCGARASPVGSGSRVRRLRRRLHAGFWGQMERRAVKIQEHGSPPARHALTSPYAARIRLPRALCSTSARPSASMTGGT